MLWVLQYYLTRHQLLFSLYSVSKCDLTLFLLYRHYCLQRLHGIIQLCCLSAKSYSYCLLRYYYFQLQHCQNLLAVAISPSLKAVNFLSQSLLYNFRYKQAPKCSRSLQSPVFHRIFGPSSTMNSDCRMLSPYRTGFAYLTMDYYCWLRSRRFHLTAAASLQRRPTVSLCMCFGACCFHPVQLFAFSHAVPQTHGHLLNLILQYSVKFLILQRLLFLLLQFLIIYLGLSFLTLAILVASRRLSRMLDITHTTCVRCRGLWSTVPNLVKNPAATLVFYNCCLGASIVALTLWNNSSFA